MSRTLLTVSRSLVRNLALNRTQPTTSALFIAKTSFVSSSSSSKRCFASSTRNIPSAEDLYNPAPAIDLINEVPPTAVEGRSIWCDGGGGPLGHPKVYINLDKPGAQTCGYCGLRFEKKSHHDHNHGHH